MAVTRRTMARRRGWTPRSGGAALVALAALLALGGGGGAEGAPRGKGALDGFVEDHRQQPLAGVEATLWVGDKEVGRAVSDAGGRYVIEGLPAGRAILRLKVRGYLPAARDLVVAGKGRTRALDTLDPGVSYAGCVRTTEGAPVAGAVVGLVRLMDISTDRPRGARAGETEPEIPAWGTIVQHQASDAEGRFELYAVTPTGRYRLRVAHPRHATAESADLPVKAGLVRDDLEVLLGPGAWMAGVVLDEKDRPVPGALVRSLAAVDAWHVTKTWTSPVEFVGDADSGLAPPEAIVLPEDPETEPVDARTDASGAFEVGAGSERTTRLHVAAPGFRLAEVALEDLAAGEGREGLTIRLERSPGPIQGLVVDPRGKPLAGAIVQWDHDAFPAHARTGKNGRFQLPRAKPREATVLRAWRSGYVAERLSGVVAGARNVRIVLQPEPRWSATLILPQDAVPPPESGRVRFARIRVRRPPAEPAAQAPQGEPGAGAPEAGEPDAWETRHHSEWIEGPETALDVPLLLGSVEVCVEVEGFEPLVLGPYEAKPSGRIDAGPIRLEPVPK